MSSVFGEQKPVYKGTTLLVLYNLFTPRAEVPNNAPCRLKD